MPDSDAPGHVQVFHFTSRISDKKISKYESASRRGMSHGDQDLATPPLNETNAISIDQGDHNMANGNARESSPDSDQPPPLKRLKLHVRKPVDKKVKLTPNDEYCEAMELDETAAVKSRPDRSERRASSDLSSLGSTPPPGRSSSAKNKGYGDFMSYYIMDNDDDDEMEDAPSRASPSANLTKAQPVTQPVEPAPSKPAAAKPTVPQTQSKRKPRAPKTQQQKPSTPVSSHQPSQTPMPQPMPAQHPPMPQQPPPPPMAQAPIAIPRIVLIDLEQEAQIRPLGKRDTVGEMIAKLHDLSRALTPFAGMPELPPLPEAAPAPKKAPSKKPDKIDGFLDMFKDNSSDEEEEEQQPPPRGPLDYYLEKPGEPDTALVYGIQFIMNALRSWANQRLQSQFNQQYIEATQQQQAEYQQQHFRRGRPRKNILGGGMNTALLQDVPAEIQMSLTNTPEGAAVRAFQEVLRSGSLQMNSALPNQLTQALAHIYMQIDRLINQGAKPDPPWQPMSYTAQIEAHRLRVAKIKDDQVRTQEAIAMQHQQHHPIHDQHALAQLHLRGQMQPQMPPAFSPEQQALDIQRRRTSQYLQQQHVDGMSPQLQGMPHPQPMQPPPSASPPLQHPPPQQQQQQQQAPPKPAGRPSDAGVKSPTATASTVDKRKASGPAQAMSNIKMYMPGWLPRSGTQMKFSFSPTQVPYHQQHMPPHPQVNMAPPVAQSVESVPSNGSVGEEIVVAPSSRNTKSQTPAPAPRESTGPAKSPATDQPTVDQPAAEKSASIPPSPALGSTSTTVSRMQGPPKDMASRFPHPGAVVVDR